MEEHLPQIPTMLLTLSPQRWSQVQFALQTWFASPYRVLLPLLGIAIALCCLGTYRWKPLLLKAVVGLAIAYLVLISPPGATFAVAGLSCFLPADDGKPAEAIVILGRGTLLEPERADQAADLWYGHRAPLILATGHGGEAPRLLRLLRDRGIPETALVEEPYARTTEENARLSAQLLHQRGVERILLITDRPHMLRALLTFRSLGFEVVPQPIPLPAHLPSVSISLTALREYVGLASYALSGRLQPRIDSIHSRRIMF